MLGRRRTLQDPVTIYLDDEPIQAERGEPLAVALLGSNKVTLARSPKLHRPRAPTCLRGACDGCLARVDGLPNVMTCLRSARGGERIETQNVLGSRESDLLRVTDWFFPQGIDHHHLMAGIPGVSSVMVSFARKLAGLGTLPDEKVTEQRARRAEADVLVVGAGISGHVVASQLAALGAKVMLVDDGVASGGSLVCAPSVHKKIADEYTLSSVEKLQGWTAVGIYRREALLASNESAVVVRPKALVFATGAHDGVLTVPNNDLPGLFSARALSHLGARGVFPLGRTAIVGDGFWADELARVLNENGASDRTVRVPLSSVAGVKGSNRVRALIVSEGKKSRTVDVDVIGHAAPSAPSFEVAEQAGANTVFRPGGGYAVACDEQGKCGDGLWAVGECTGLPFEPDRLIENARSVAKNVAATLTLNTHQPGAE
ncbi:MAG: (2Fe-2S)-binding protein [Polyangiaceae bacterium]|nr:(2Fe-2S)-binding protein [Polyangiaceae bacterium]